MQLSVAVESLSQDLAVLGGLGDEATARAAERLVAALGPTATVRLLDVLGQAAAEVSAQLPEGQVELRVSGDDAALVLVLPPDPEPVIPGDGADGASRITLRLPEQLKARIESLADQEGVSTNAWLVRALSRAVHPDGFVKRRVIRGSRISGFGQA
ncbi:MAG TPA: toxin-antitoxin system HicB family antitoxin [Acidimicrobiales bacterium]|nr:toxin-antitoxin system HicB family antitoxin [Acidimicrobiales bacterium]